MVLTAKWIGTAAALALLVACTLNAALGWNWFGWDAGLVARVGWLPFFAALRWVVMPWADGSALAHTMSFERKRSILAGPVALALVGYADAELGLGWFGRYGVVTATLAGLTALVLIICLGISPYEVRQHRDRERAGRPENR